MTHNNQSGLRRDEQRIPPDIRVEQISPRSQQSTINHSSSAHLRPPQSIYAQNAALNGKNLEKTNSASAQTLRGKKAAQPNQQIASNSMLSNKSVPQAQVYLSGRGANIAPVPLNAQVMLSANQLREQPFNEVPVPMSRTYNSQCRAREGIHSYNSSCPQKSGTRSFLSGLSDASPRNMRQGGVKVAQPCHKEDSKLTATENSDSDLDSQCNNVDDMDEKVSKVQENQSNDHSPHLSSKHNTQMTQGSIPLGIEPKPMGSNSYSQRNNHFRVSELDEDRLEELKTKNFRETINLNIDKRKKSLESAYQIVSKSSQELRSHRKITSSVPKTAIIDLTDDNTSWINRADQVKLPFAAPSHETLQKASSLIAQQKISPLPTPPDMPKRLSHDHKNRQAEENKEPQDAMDRFVRSDGNHISLCDGHSSQVPSPVALENIRQQLLEQQYPSISQVQQLVSMLNNGQDQTYLKSLDQTVKLDPSLISKIIQLLLDQQQLQANERSSSNLEVPNTVVASSERDQTYSFAANSEWNPPTFQNLHEKDVSQRSIRIPGMTMESAQDNAAAGHVSFMQDQPLMQCPSKPVVEQVSTSEYSSTSSENANQNPLPQVEVEQINQAADLYKVEYSENTVFQALRPDSQATLGQLGQMDFNMINKQEQLPRLPVQMMKNNSAMTPNTPNLKHNFISSKVSDGKRGEFEQASVPYFTPKPLQDELDKETIALTANPEGFILSANGQRDGQPEHSFNSKSQMSQIPGPSFLSGTNENNSENKIFESPKNSSRHSSSAEQIQQMQQNNSTIGILTENSRNEICKSDNTPLPQMASEYLPQMASESLPQMASESPLEVKKKSLVPLNRFPTVKRMQSVDSPVEEITGFSVKQNPDEVGAKEEEHAEIKIEEQQMVVKEEVQPATTSKPGETKAAEEDDFFAALMREMQQDLPDTPVALPKVQVPQVPIAAIVVAPPKVPPISFNKLINKPEEIIQPRKRSLKKKPRSGEEVEKRLHKQNSAETQHQSKRFPSRQLASEIEDSEELKHCSSMPKVEDSDQVIEDLDSFVLKSPPILTKKGSIESVISEDIDESQESEDQTPQKNQKYKHGQQSFQKPLYSVKEENSSQNKTSFQDDFSMSTDAFVMQNNNRLRLNSIHSLKIFNNNWASQQLDQSTSKKSYIEAPEESGNHLIDAISKFAFIHNIDPKIFLDKEHALAEKAIQQLQLTMSPTAARPKNQRRGALNTTQHPVPLFMSQEIYEIRDMLIQMSEKPEDSEQVERTSSFENQKMSPNGKNSPFLNLSKNKIQHRRPSSQSNKTDKVEKSKQKDQQQAKAIKKLDEQSLRQKAQIMVLSLSLNCSLQMQKRMRKIINNQKYYIENHDRDLKSLKRGFQILQKPLHFAFLFASPIVFQKQGRIIKYFPQLNFTQEFVKIRERIEAAKIKINITRRSCTTTSLQEILGNKPLGLHFSGHGVLNNEKEDPDFHSDNKGQGDFLVLETDKGDSELVSREQLKKMIRHNKCELEFVFVASCHSEFVGRIFQQAGAKHVICIKHSQEVMDDAIITFTDTFYRVLFENKEHICTAFYQAQLSVEIRYSKKEASIFFLLLGEETDKNGPPRISSLDESNSAKGSAQNGFYSMRSHVSGQRDNKKHRCSPFMTRWTEGDFNLISPQSGYLQTKVPKMPNLRGRQKDKFRVLEKLLSDKKSRLFNLIGWPGMGKSALIASVLDYIDERGLLKGGIIYFNAKNLSFVELFIRNFNQVLISENPKIFSFTTDRNQLKNQPLKTFMSILEQIALIKHDIVIVIDNVEELIANERIDFQRLISMILTRVSTLKVLLTSQRPLQMSRDFKEDQIILDKLSSAQSLNLFKEVMARDLDQYEINQLLQVKPDPEKYPDERFKTYIKLEDHHFFTILNGNPQSIILVASLFTDQQRRLTLKQVYKKLTDDELAKVMSEEGIADSMLMSIRVSAQLAFQTIQDNDPESMDLLYLLSLLPGGISPDDLDYLWSKVTQEHRKFQIEQNHSGRLLPPQLGNTPAISANNSYQSKMYGQNVSNKGAGVASKLTKASPWQRALQVLQNNKLAEVRRQIRRAYNTKDSTGKRKLGKGHSLESDGKLLYGENQDDAAAERMIVLPGVVSNFAEGKITEEIQEFFLSIISEWYCEMLHQIYIKNENISYLTQRGSSLQNNSAVSREFERIEENFTPLLQLMQEKYQDDKCSSPKVAPTGEDTSDNSSLTDEGYTEQMDQLFDAFAAPQNSLNRARTDGDKASEPDYIKVPPVPMSAAAQQQAAGANAKFDGRNQIMATMQKKHSSTITPKSVGSFKTEKTNNLELLQAYKDITSNALKPALERFNAIQKQKDGKKLQPNEFSEDPEVRARQRWLWAYQMVQKRLKRELTESMNTKAALQSVPSHPGENERDGSWYSDSCDSSDISEAGDRMIEEVSMVAEVSPDQVNNTSTQLISKQKSKLAHVGMQQQISRRLKKQLSMPSNTLQMNFQRHSMKQKQISQFSRQKTTRQSIYEHRRQTEIQGADKEMLREEKTMVYYLVNLILFKHYNMANSLIKKHFLKMRNCSEIFKANVRRLQALSLQYEGIERKKKPQAVQSSKTELLLFDKCDRRLKRAEKYFKRANSAWGLGLTYYQQANSLIQRSINNQKNQSTGSGPLMQQIAGAQTGFSKTFKDESMQRRGTNEREQLVYRAKELLMQAVGQFEQINHWRGLYMSYRHLAQLHSQQDIATESDSVATTIREVAQYQEQYLKYREYFYQEISDNGSELTIQRRDDEILSLLVELVFTKQKFKLFSDPAEPDSINEDQMHRLNIPKKLTKTPSSNLSSVNEGESEHESHTVYPKIEIDGETIAVESHCTNDQGQVTFTSSDARRINNALLQQQNFKNYKSSTLSEVQMHNFSSAGRAVEAEENSEKSSQQYRQSSNSDLALAKLTSANDVQRRKHKSFANTKRRLIGSHDIEETTTRLEDEEDQ